MSGSPDPVASISASDVWVVMPVFNEAAVVRSVLEDLLGTFPNVVCVDDGSTDGSVGEVRAAGVDLVRHPVNLGQGASIQTGVEYARTMPGAACFVTFDADGQHRPADAWAMVERLRVEPVDIILGSRFAPGSRSRVPMLRSWSLQTIAHLSPRVRRLRLTDAHNGLRAFNRRVADALDLRASRMGHASEMLALIEEHGWRVAEHPADVVYSDYSRAKGQSLLNGVNIITEGFARGRRV